MKTKQENAISYYALYSLAIIYFVISIAALALDFGEKGFVLSFVSIVAYIVPTAIPTAAITPIPSSSAFILSFAWSMIIPTCAVMLLFADWSQIDGQKINKKEVLTQLLAATFLLLIFIFFMREIVPQPDYISRIKFLYKYLKNTIWFVVIYGFFLWVATSVVLFSMIYKFVFLIKSRKGYQ